MTQLQLNATVLPNGVLTIPLPIQWQSRNVKVVVETEELFEPPLSNDFDRMMRSKFNPNLFGRVCVLGDIVSPLEDEWESMT